MTCPVLGEIHLYPIKSLGGIAVERWHLDGYGLYLDRRWMVVDREGRFLTQRRYPQMARVIPELVWPDGGSGTTNPAPSLSLRHPRLGVFQVPAADPEAPRVPVTVWNDRVEAVPVGEGADRWLSAAIGVPCRLVWFPDGEIRQVDPRYARRGEYTAFSDGFPLLLIGQASLDDLNRRLEAKGFPSLPMRRFRPNLVVSGSAAYAEDHWRRIRIGRTPLRVVKPCSRCIVTTVDPATGRRAGQEPLATLATYRRQGNGVCFGQNLVHEGQGGLAVGDAVEVISAGN